MEALLLERGEKKLSEDKLLIKDTYAKLCACLGEMFMFVSNCSFFCGAFSLSIPASSAHHALSQGELQHGQIEATLRLAKLKGLG